MARPKHYPRMRARAIDGRALCSASVARAAAASGPKVYVDWPRPGRATADPSVDQALILGRAERGAIGCLLVPKHDHAPGLRTAEEFASELALEACSAQ